MDRIQAIAAARFAIEDVMLRYAEGIDVGDIETVGEVFAEGELVMPDGSSLVGQTQVFEHFSNLIIFYDEDGIVFLPQLKIFIQFIGNWRSRR